MLTIGDRAPDFELPSTKGETFKLSKALEKNAVLLAFYPFDWSPVCTNELGYFNTNLADFRGAKVGLAAISVDSPFSHGAWAKSEKLKFPLLSDFNRDVCRAYDVLHDELMGLKAFAKRSVFLVDQAQTIRYCWVSEDPGNEPDYAEVMAAAQAL